MPDQDIKNKKNLDSSLRLIAKTSFIVLIGLFLSKIFTYFFRIIAARYFGPEVYGLFSLSLMIVGLLTSFASLGFSQGILRFVPLYRGKKEEEKIKYLVKISSRVTLISGLISGLLLFLFAEFISVNIFHTRDLIIFLKISAFLVPVTLLFTLYSFLIRAYEKTSAYSLIYNALSSFLNLTLIGMFIFLGFKGESTILSYSIATFLCFLAAYYYCRYGISNIFKPELLDSKEKKSVFLEFFSYSWPIVFYSLILSLFAWIDSFAIGLFRTPIEVGIYNAALPISMLFFMVPDLFMQLFFPLANREYSKKNISLIREISKQVGKWIFIINLPVFIILILFPGAAINILFGSEYLPGEMALRILCLGSFIFSISSVSHNLISMTGRTKTILFNTFIATTCNLILNLILVPKYGINGAAFSTSFSLIILSALSIYQANKYASIIPFRRKMLTIFLLSLIPLFFLIIIKQYITINLFSLAILIIMFFALYFLLILLGKGFDKNDRMILNLVKDKLFKRRSI